MKKLIVLLFSMGISAAAWGAAAATAESAAPLAVGTAVPAATVHATDGSAVELADVVGDKPTVLIFYRGGWCPYCNRHLEALQTIEADLLALGYQIIALSPDRPEALPATTEKNHLNYRLFSDRTMAAADAYGVAFVVPDEIVEKYGQWNIDLAPLPGDETKRWLPVPAVFIIAHGEVRFVHSEVDYKVRLSTEDMLAAAKASATAAAD